MISGGSTDGDSNRAKKSRSRRDCMEVERMRGSEVVISFGPEDLKGFCECYLYGCPGADGFARVSAGDRGEREIVLPLTLGSRDLKKTVMTTFSVVDSPSLYNIILGRPAMNELRAVASTYHQKIKFPVGSRVGKVRGDLPSSRKCYVEAVRVGQSKARKAWKKTRIVEIGGRVVEKGEVHFVAEEEQEVVEVGPGQQIQVARDLSVSTRELTGISPLISEHHLNVLPGSHMVKEKKRHFGPEKDKVIDEQVRDLLKVGHIREIQFSTWFSNVGYHQIPLAKDDQDKASFITFGGKFCYVVMPFGLKNAGDTYQRLMNKDFEKQLGRNVEVYVDDILGKSKEVADIITDLEETFATLMHYGIKLNPAKYIFGVKSGKFLGFIVTNRGIDVNQEKVKSVLCMPSPRSVKEVQKLTGRIASLSRFISRSAHISYPFFQVLKKAQQFGCDEKCEQTFQDMKIHLAELLVLVKLEPGEKLFVYLSTTEYAVSSLLIKEEDSD
ncbi:uncharacterized protein LOC142523878 [Primulina tabacum]|uniref:uncharacterized protein LOC142523878 n=1 Tax=Primulina tabacum TaxID=48773 RepID=UPI003F5915C8